MKILAVSSCSELLSALDSILKGLFPGVAIVHMADPLMAGKYAFHNRVDILLADAEMKRMDGAQLARFVRQEQPAVRTYLMGRRHGPYETLSALPEGVAGFIPYPLAADRVAAILAPEHSEGKKRDAGFRR